MVGAPTETDALVTFLASQDTMPWYKRKHLRMLYIIFIPTLLGVEMTSGYVNVLLLLGLQAVDSWDNYFGNPRSALLGLMSAIYSLGAILVLPVVPLICDKLGRRGGIVFGSILMLIGAAIQTASQSIAMFIISRFILGMGIPFAIVAASSLIGELSHPNQRATMGSLFNACWFIGSIVAAGTTLGTFRMVSSWAWRLPSVLQAAPSIMQIAFIFWLPESPRWLISRGRGDEAFAILAKYHAEGDMDSEFVKAEYAQIEQTLKLEVESSRTSWGDLVKTPGMRRRVLVGAFLGLATQWSGNGLTSYYLARVLETVGITDNSTRNKINLAQTCWGFINATFFALTASRFPRRWVYLTCTISMTVVFTAWTVASARFTEDGSNGASVAVVFFIFLYSPMYNVGYNALTYTFLVELFPFHVRAKGISVFQWFSRAAGFFNQFVNPIGMKEAGWKYYISYCIFLLFEVIFVYFLFPETSGRTLEELAFLYEGKEREEQQKRVQEELHAEGDGKDSHSDRPRVV
ncbi:hexose transporter [Pterulicium gracile]|uniref:Hexose transporter n=1 Tax=Pterulicium gracile TaxID=1884261 RepID=A0A5C3Q9I6_9AGAR|nr:hexose transporter [Pterula gracilis]